MTNRTVLVIAALFLLFLVSTSAQFASISSVQEQLREAQLKLQLKIIGEKVLTLQGEVLKVGKEEIVAVSPLPEAVSREELEAGLENQIKMLETVVASLRPKAREEEIARIEQRVQEISQEVRTTNDEEALQGLQAELEELVASQAVLQAEVGDSLAEELKRQQALLLQAKVRELQARIQNMPKEPSVSQAAQSSGAKKPDPATLRLVQDEIEKVQIRLLQTKAKAIQEQINSIGK